METSLDQQTILVTGASGLLGARVVPLLSRSLPEARIIAANRNMGDLKEKEFWSKLPETITTVIHLAAFIPWKPEQRNDERVVQENRIPIEMLIEHSRRWPGLEQVIYSSSVSVYEPTGEWLDESSTTRQ